MNLEHRLVILDASEMIDVDVVVVADDEDECDDDYDDDDGDAIVGNLIRLTPFCLNRVDVFVLVHQLSFYHRNFRCPNELMKWNNHFRM